MPMRNPFLNIILITACIVLMTQCGTFLNYQISQVEEWIEGKPYPINISFVKVDKISNVVLYYSFNGQPPKSVQPQQMGKEFNFTIPENEVEAGYLSYYIAYYFKDKKKLSSTIDVRVLTIEEAREKFKKELLNRIQFNPPKEALINRDLNLELYISNTDSSTGVFFYSAISGEMEFREEKLINSNGKFSCVITRQDLEMGYNSYYFKISEMHPDVGELEVFMPGPSQTYTFKILTLDELRNIMKGELLGSIYHAFPDDVWITRDLTLKLLIEYPGDSYIRMFSQNKLTVSLYYGIEGQPSSFKEVSLKGYDNKFSHVIKALELEAGYNAYYYYITEETLDVGIIEVFYPAEGNLKPYVYNIIGIDEIKQIKENDLYQRISHSPFNETDGISELPITLRVSGATGNTSAILNIKKQTQSDYKTIDMSRKEDLFTGVISIDDQQNGYTQYFFTVQEYDSEVGLLSVVFPENGAISPFQYRVLDINEVRMGLENNLYSRIVHIPVTETKEGEDLQIVFTVSNIIRGTKAYIYYKKPGEISYIKTEMKGSDNSFMAVIPKADIRNGYSQYYIEVSEPHDYFSYITVTVPKEGPESPYSFNIIKLKDLLYNGIDFTNLSDIDYGTPVNVSIRLNYLISGTEVFFKYRLEGDTIEYHFLEMHQSDNLFSVELSHALLQAGKRIDYYFLITVKSEDLEFTYPEENFIPLFFHVNEVEQITYYSLETKIIPTPSGSINLDPEPIEGNRYISGERVTITPIPVEGYQFDRWDGDLSGSTSPITITVDSDMLIIARFKKTKHDDKHDHD